VFTHAHIPLNNTHYDMPSPCGVDPPHELHLVRQNSAYFDFICTSQGRLPKIHFPMFVGGETPLKRSCCENYFEMYGVQSSLWVKVVSMHFERGAAH
jgi:hypothetical protein